jgi:hypothetical protein
VRLSGARLESTGPEKVRDRMGRHDCRAAE